MTLRSMIGVLGLASSLFAVPAKAAYIIDVQQVGSGVTFTGSGSINTSGLEKSGTIVNDGVPNSIDPIIGRIIFGGGSLQSYSGVNGPNAYGTGDYNQASSGSGAAFFFSNGNTIGLPFDYVAGQQLGVSEMTFKNSTLASLGISEGSQRYTWGTGDNADFLLLSAGVPTVPLPASAPLFGAALMALGLVGYGLKRKKVSDAA